jgi:hypothetical protein
MRKLFLALTALLGLGWFGLRTPPKPFPPYPKKPDPFGATVPLPDGLPTPVHRFYQTTYGDRVPVIRSAVFTITGRLTFGPITFPARMRFTHDAGQAYRHYIETTVFGWPLMRVNERYLDGVARMELPFGTVEGHHKLNSAANLGLWGETLFMPPVFLTDPRVRWEPIDSEQARLIVPFEGGEDSFTVWFDPVSGKITKMHAMRWKEIEDTAPTGWTLKVHDWRMVDGLLLPVSGSVTWADANAPWLDMTIHDAAFNVDVSQYIRQRGL